MKERVVVAIYIHPDYYPPTINAINCLADMYKEVVVVTNNNCKDDFFNADNIKVVKIGNFFSPIDYEKTSTLYKIFTFLKFTFQFFKASFNKETNLILMYDAIPLFSYFTFKFFINKKKTTWYHNHDMPMIKGTKKYSVGWFSAKYEHKVLQLINIFSLPTSDRLKYYPTINNNTKYFELPNFPSQKIYNSNITNSTPSTDNVIKIIYQGTIGEAHSIEEIVLLLNEKIEDKYLHLTLKGKVRKNYKDSIDKLAESIDVADKIEWIGIGPYRDVQYITKTKHIGIGIHIGEANDSKPQGTASNKIYEYAACGLPVLVYDNEQFRKHLGKYSWAIFTDGSTLSLKNAILFCTKNFDTLSKAAKQDFNSHFYFEKSFNNIKLFLEKN